ncbi:MAG: DUF2325 domain-containing protein [Gammaproteobacteria bacterium]|nr:DUF2325 domain-containing protein [Gammaproteobacteria bacterium]
MRPLKAPPHPWAIPESPPDDAGLKRKSRRKLWDLARNLHCPLIGTCLEVDELHRVARKARARFDGPLSDYDIHVCFVSNAEEKNALSVATHKALDRKFASHLRRFAGARTVTELAALWEEACARGEVPGALWATLTHPACDEDLRTFVYEEVHMLSHQIGAGQRADLKALTSARAELEHLRHDFDALHSRTRTQLQERDQRIMELENALRESDTERRRGEGQRQALQAMVDDLQASTAHQKVVEARRTAEHATARLLRVERDRDRLQQAWETKLGTRTNPGTGDGDRDLHGAAMEHGFAETLHGCEGCTEETCALSRDLGGRRILCVGGRIEMVEQYRAVVTGLNGRFEHHDGGLEERRQRLEALLSSADAVVCATDCVSHDAYYRLKRFCKAHRKPHVFLQSSGLTSFTRAVEAMAG